MKGLQRLILLVLMVSAQPSFGGTVTYIYTDPQGTPLAEADAQGHITQQFDYRPYGTLALGTAPNGPGYTGHVNDPDTGLVYMQARYYDPENGRFLSVDPITPEPGNLFNFNRFDYANNNPAANIDSSGRSSCRATQGANESEPCLPPPPEPEKAPILPMVVVTAKAPPRSIEVPAAPLFLVRAAGASLFLVDSNKFHEMIYGTSCCYGAIPSPHILYNLPPGFWPADTGAEEWGRRHGVNPAKARGKFHDIKGTDTAHKGGKQNWGVNPDTGEVIDPEGEVHGELNQ